MICNPLCIVPTSVGSLVILLMVFGVATLLQQVIVDTLERQGLGVWIQSATIFVFGAAISTWSLWSMLEHLK